MNRVLARVLSVPALLAGLFLPLHATSAEFGCTASVAGVLVYRDGWVNVKHTGRNDWTFVCNLSTPWKGVSVSTCAMWTSLLMQLKKDGKRAEFLYYSDPDVTSCTGLLRYGSAPAPYYIGTLEDTPPAASASKAAAEIAAPAVIDPTTGVPVEAKQ